MTPDAWRAGLILGFALGVCFGLCAPLYVRAELDERRHRTHTAPRSIPEPRRVRLVTRPYDWQEDR